jgi:hypothetical protein
VKYHSDGEPQIRRVTFDLAQLTHAFFFWLNDTLMIAPCGFVFDGASIPWFFWWVATPFTSWIVEASLIHDLLYRCYNMREFWVWVDRRYRPLTRWEIDRIFLDIMHQYILASNVSRNRKAIQLRKARRCYQAVRLVGGLVIGDGNGRPPKDVQKYLDKNKGKC